MLKAVAARAGADLGLDARLSSSTRGVKRDVVHEYPAAYPDSSEAARERIDDGTVTVPSFPAERTAAAGGIKFPADGSCR